MINLRIVNPSKEQVINQRRQILGMVIHISGSKHVVALHASTITNVRTNRSSYFTP